MDWIVSESLGVVRPSFADGLIWCEALQSLQSLGEVVGIEERSEVIAKLLVILVVIAPDGRLLEVRFIRSTWPLVVIRHANF